MKIKLFALMLIASYSLTSYASDISEVTMSLEKTTDNALVIQFKSAASSTFKSQSVFVTYNVFYSGDNYTTPVALYKDEPSLGTTPNMSGQIVLDDSFVKNEWVPKIMEYVKNPKIWVEYRINDGAKIISNTLAL